MTSLDLFAVNKPGHDPGGRVKTALPPGLRGDAVFSPCGCYRRRLRRWVGDAFPERYLLLIGLNPSTADATANDPTITRAWGFAVREGYEAFVKVNLGDDRATRSSDLLKPGVVACSPANLDARVEAASGAEKVVACWGQVNRALKPTALGVAHTLRVRGQKARASGATV